MVRFVHQSSYQLQGEEGEGQGGYQSDVSLISPLQIIRGMDGRLKSEMTGRNRWTFCQPLTRSPPPKINHTCSTVVDSGPRGDSVHQLSWVRICVCVARGLLAAGCHRLPHPQRRPPAPGGSSRTRLCPRIRRHLSLPGSHRSASRG